MGSPLDFASTDGFRKTLLAKNLLPYPKAPSKGTTQIDYEYTQSSYSVIDSPDYLIDDPVFANNLYPLNQWGNEGGYQTVSVVNGLNNTKSNQGEYGPGQQDAKLLDQGFANVDSWKTKNVYSNGEESVVDGGEYIMQTDIISYPGLINNQPYPTFVFSMYSPLSILLSPDPQGSDGLLSQDSFIAKLGAQTLKKEFEERIATQIRQQTIGRANLFSVRSGTDIVGLLTGRIPLIEPNWTITIPSNPIVAATDFALRLGGSILPVSPIPGSYFDPTINPKQPTTLGQIANAFKKTDVGKFFTSILGTNQVGSQLFYENTGSGQKSLLFNNIDYNKYKPYFERTLFDRVVGELVGDTTNNAQYYVGSTTSDPSQVFSPTGQLPIDELGREIQSPVYGPQELAQLYEGPSSKVIRLGANGPTYSDGGWIEGGLTWVSPKYKGNAGKTVGINGEIYQQDEDFRPSSFNNTESTQIEFKTGSILDKTQRLVDSQPDGARRYQHIGNAIDQISKVFHDGYKEMTKGSKVLKYVNQYGVAKGTEYCRVFTKDIPYLQYNDLQKTDGMTKSGRKFEYSVLDNTFNLNIAPNKMMLGQSSTNLINDSANGISYAKKYMFSLENLAWRTSRTPGLSVSDLPVCERGPNGGRVMWFPPYGLTFDENISANWKGNDFIGRPEPIYTYNNTTRTGSLKWSIVVDHPSVLNVIVDKVLKNETNQERINSIIDSFFAGCTKYDLYELAKLYYRVDPNTLKVLQDKIVNSTTTQTEINFIKQTIQTGNEAPTPSDQQIIYEESTETFGIFFNVGLYFDNDYPKKGTEPYNYNSLYTNYIAKKPTYAAKPDGPSLTNFFDTVVTPNFDRVKEFMNVIKSELSKTEGELIIEIDASCSAPATQQYNVQLSERRIESFINYFSTDSELKKYMESSPKRLIVRKGRALGETTTSTPDVFNSADNTWRKGSTVTCTDDVGDTENASQEVFTTRAMACRRSYIGNIINNLKIPKKQDAPSSPIHQDVLVGNTVTNTVTTSQVEQQEVDRDNITKWVLRQLLTECDYFEMIKESTPMVFDSLKEKLKYFQPAFHSMTPEGLNSRLTFLQQCMRPGDTIPTVKDLGGGKQTLVYNDAINTSFGSPPVLVLRVGDFFHTKIIPTSLSFQYENLDLNPEGIGVQPMIANVTMQFNFVGGHGLKNSIDKLQNALTFNYYANTEMWDDRADVTDLSYKIWDQEYLNAINEPLPPTINQSDSSAGKSNGDTIGTVLTSNVDVFETGTTQYSEFMVNVVDQTQTYFQTMINKSKEINSQYNNSIRQQIMLERSYTSGFFAIDETTEVALFGKPRNIQNRLDTILEDYLTDIENELDVFMQFLNQPSLNFDSKLIKRIKKNYISYLKNKNKNFQSSLTKIIQDITNTQQTFLNTLGEVNTITYKGDTDPDSSTDGYQQKNGLVVIYKIKGTDDVSAASTASNTLDELIDDVTKIKDSIMEYNLISESAHTFNYTVDKQSYEGNLFFQVDGAGDSIISISTSDVFIPFSRKTELVGQSLILSLQDNTVFRRVYTFLCDDILDDKKYEAFRNFLLSGVESNPKLFGKGKDNIGQAIDDYWKVKVKSIFSDETNITNEFISYVESQKLKDFVKFTPFPKKNRVFTFTTDNDSTDIVKTSQDALIKGLGATRNINADTNTWDDNPPGTTNKTFVSKVKLN